MLHVATVETAISAVACVRQLIEGRINPKTAHRLLGEPIVYLLVKKSSCSQ